MTVLAATATDRAGRRIAHLAIVLTVALATFVWTIRFFGAKAPVREAEWWIGDIALASVFALPACIGLIALRGRTYLLRSAGAVAVVLAVVLAISIVSLPLIVPGVLFLIAANRFEAPRDGRALVVTLLAGLVAAGAFAALIVAPRQVVCWSETKYTDGRTSIERDHSSERRSADGSFSMSGGPPRAGVVSESGGCTEGVFPPARSFLALGAVGAVTLLTWRLA